MGILVKRKAMSSQGRIVIAEPGATRDHGPASIYVLQCKHAQRVGPELTGDVALLTMPMIGANATARRALSRSAGKLSHRENDRWRTTRTCSVHAKVSGHPGGPTRMKKVIWYHQTCCALSSARADVPVEF